MKHTIENLKESPTKLCQATQHIIKLVGVTVPRTLPQLVAVMLMILTALDGRVDISDVFSKHTSLINDD